MNKLRKITLGVVAFLMAVTTLPLTQVGEASAVSHIGRLYFSNTAQTVTRMNCQVIPYGIDEVGFGSSNTLKARFINMISTMSTTNDRTWCSELSTGSSRGPLKQLGSRYIIQTQRGQGVGASYSISAAAMADWKARVNNPDITVTREAYSYTLNTATYWHSNRPGTSTFDVGQFNLSGTSDALVFRHNGKVVYAIRIACGNPVGVIGELPKPSDNFELHPSIDVTPDVAEAGSSATIDASVDNKKDDTSPDAAWQVTRFTLNPGDAVPAAAVNKDAPTTYYGGSTVESGSKEFPKGATSLTVPAQTIPDVPVGTRICYALSVKPYNKDDDNQWSHSDPDCITISKRPKVQVLGGDLLVGRGSASNEAAASNVVTSTTVKSGKTYGSWAEYAIVPRGCVVGMASGSGYVDGTTIGSFASLSLLSFTNPSGRSCSSNIGGYVDTTIAPNVSTRFAIQVAASEASSTRPANPQVLPSTTIDFNSTSPRLSGTYQAPAGATSLKIAGGTIGAGRWVVINAPGTTVTIEGNIRYTTSSLSSAKDIPQVIIIAKNIIISSAVSQIDAWLVAVGSDSGATQNGIINTCGAGTGVTQTNALTVSLCSTKLTVNGPVMANHLIMRRTAGSGTGANSGNPAEVFNLRADAYIWATNYNLGSGRITTASTKDLPPRF